MLNDNTAFIQVSFYNSLNGMDSSSISVDPNGDEKLKNNITFFFYHDN